MAKKISKEKKLKRENGELKKAIKDQQEVINILSNKEVTDGFKSALDDLKKGDFTILTKCTI